MERQERMKKQFNATWWGKNFQIKWLGQSASGAKNSWQVSHIDYDSNQQMPKRRFFLTLHTATGSDPYHAARQAVLAELRELGEAPVDSRRTTKQRGQPVL